MTDTHKPAIKAHITQLFQFTVEVWLRPAEFLEQSPAATADNDPRAALASEIRSNLESLPGVFHATATPHRTPDHE